jgi:hypothetical protein
MTPLSIQDQIQKFRSIDKSRQKQNTHRYMEMCCRLIVVSKFVYDLQADKSLVVVKGPFFPRVVNPRYRIRGTNV